MSHNQKGLLWARRFDRHCYYYLVSQPGCSTEVRPQPKCEAVQWLVLSACRAFCGSNLMQLSWTGEKQKWAFCCPVMKPAWLTAQQNGHWLKNVFSWRGYQHKVIWKKEDLWWAALQMEKLSIGIELNKYSSLNVSKMPPPAQPRKRRKTAWEPAHNLVWGCLRQEWSLICCHFPYTGHHGKIKWQK